MTKDIQFMVKHFPAYRQSILLEYRNNDEFKTLCEDFYSSAAYMKSFREEALRSKRSELEYEMLFHELEREIQNFLNTSDRDAS